MTKSKHVGLRTAGLAAAVAAMLGGGCLPYSTDSDEIGVRYCRWWCVGERSELIPPGQTVFRMPFNTDFYTLNISVQNFYMTMDTKTGDRPERDDIVFKTREGNNMGQDVVLNWKIDHAQADKVISQVGAEMDNIREKYVRPLARSIVRDFLNQLNSSEFYESQRRFSVVRRAEEELRKRFARYGIIVDRVDLQDYRFEDAEYQKAINNAKNAGQDLERYQRQVESERQHWAGELAKEVGESNKKIAEADGVKRRNTLEADAAFVESENKAQAILAEKRAEAAAIRKMREAMASRGGTTAVAMQYVESFRPDEIVVLPCDESGGVSVNRLDLNEILGGEVSRESSRK